MTHHAAALIQNFISDTLAGDINNFRTFDFKSLKNSAKYGAPGENFDCDDTLLMRAIYTVLWGSEFPGLSMEQPAAGRRYRGDTMNSFHTMFGREIAGKPGFFAGVEKYAPSEEFRERVRRFGKLCSNLGNYILLPHWYACGTTLNFYRGTNEWHDFFDRFLIELCKVLCNAEEQDETLIRLWKSTAFTLINAKVKKISEKWSKLFFLRITAKVTECPENFFPATSTGATQTTVNSIFTMPTSTLTKRNPLSFPGAAR